MKKVSKQMRNMEATDKPEMTLGLDMGDRYSHYCLLNQQGEVVEEGRMQSTESALRLLTRLGHQVIVANARKIPAITGSESKNDRNRGPQRQVFVAGVERCREAGTLCRLRPQAALSA
jgi:hypothetical protein